MKATKSAPPPPPPPPPVTVTLEMTYEEAQLLKRLSLLNVSIPPVVALNMPDVSREEVRDLLASIHQALDTAGIKPLPLRGDVKMKLIYMMEGPHHDHARGQHARVCDRALC